MQKIIKLRWNIFSLVLLAILGSIKYQAAAQSRSGATNPARQPADDKKRLTTTWLVLRHAEREGEADQLSVAGVERAQVLQQLGQIFNVDAIYSTNTARTRNTVGPLATARKIEIQTYAEPSPQWLAEIQSRHPGGVVMIVGHSNTAGLIAGKLAGRKPFTIDHDEYDSLFIITTEHPVSDKNSDDVQSNSIQNSSVPNSSPKVVRLKYGSPSVGAPFARQDQMGRIQDPVRD